MVNADTGVHPDLLNSRFGYVSISRASHEATLFTDDITKLNPQLSADVSKTSAIEISQSPSVVQGIEWDFENADYWQRQLRVSFSSISKTMEDFMVNSTNRARNYDNIRAGIVDLLKTARSLRPEMSIRS